MQKTEFEKVLGHLVARVQSFVDKKLGLVKIFVYKHRLILIYISMTQTVQMVCFRRRLKVELLLFNLLCISS